MNPRKQAIKIINWRVLIYTVENVRCWCCCWVFLVGFKYFDNKLRHPKCRTSKRTTERKTTHAGKMIIKLFRIGQPKIYQKPCIINYDDIVMNVSGAMNKHRERETLRREPTNKIYEEDKRACRNIVFICVVCVCAYSSVSLPFDPTKLSLKNVYTTPWTRNGHKCN